MHLGTVLAVLGVSPDREHDVVIIPTEIDPSGRGWVPAWFVQAGKVGNGPVIQPPPVPEEKSAHGAEFHTLVFA